MRQILLLVLFAAALFGLLIYSQWSPPSNQVSGIIEGYEIRLGSRVGGRVKSVLVAEGDQVSAGAALIEFEPFDIAERAQQAAAVLAEREAALAMMQAGLRPQEVAQAKARLDQADAELSLLREGPRLEEIEAAQNRVVAAEAVRDLATRERDRSSELYRSNAISKSEYDQAHERFAEASANLQIRQNELAILQAGARAQEIANSAAKKEEARLSWELAKQGFRAEEIAQAVAARDSAQAALAALVRQKAELTIVAPTDGYVDSLDLQPGDLVAPNAPVMTILSMRSLWVRAYVPQRLMQLRLGQVCQVTVDAYPDRTYQGKVTFISNQAEFTPGNVQTPDDRAKQVYRIRVTINDAQHVLRPGMTADVWLQGADLQP